MNKVPSTPIVLAQLATWKRDRIREVCRRIELALAADDIGRAHRVITDHELTQQESPPIESLLDKHACERLRRRGVICLDDLRAAADQLGQWPELSDRLRRRVRMVLERLG